MGTTYTISSGETVSGLVVGIGDYLLDAGTLVSGSIYGSALLDYGGRAIRSTIESSGTLSIASGTLSAITILSDGQVTADQHSVVNGGTILSGARLFVLNDSTASGLTIASGGALLLPTSYDLGSPSGPGKAAEIHVESGGLVVLGTGAAFNQATLDPGAIVASTGVVLETSTLTKVAPVISGFTLAAGSNEYVLNGGTAVHAIVDGIFISSGFSEGYSGEQVIEKGGTAINTVVSNGLVAVEGTLQGATVLSGFVGLVSGGVATDVHVSGGELDIIFATVTDIVIDGGLVNANEFSHIPGTVVDGGVFQTFGTVTDTLVNGGSLLDDGSALATTISAGGELLVSNKDYASGTVVGSGGVVVLSTGVHGLVNTTLLKGGTIDLTRFAFVSGATATLSKKDVLTVSAGGKTEKLSLVGNYNGLQFVTGADQSAGTEITVSAAFPAASMAAEALSAGTRAILQDMQTGSISATRQGSAARDNHVVGGGRSQSLPEHEGNVLILHHLT